MLPADSASRAGSTPEASGDSSSGTFDSKMIILTHDGFSPRFKTVYSIRHLEGGRYDVGRKTPYSDQHETISGPRAEALDNLLRDLPGPHGKNDIEDSLYDGDVLTIDRGDDRNTIVALSLPSRVDAAQWWTETENVLTKQ